MKKLSLSVDEATFKFESSVIPYGEKTTCASVIAVGTFESSVIPYGEKTLIWQEERNGKFESSVIPYGEKFNICTKTL